MITSDFKMDLINTGMRRVSLILVARCLVLATRPVTVTVSHLVTEMSVAFAREILQVVFFSINLFYCHYGQLITSPRTLREITDCMVLQ